MAGTIWLHCSKLDKRKAVGELLKLNHCGVAKGIARNNQHLTKQDTANGTQKICANCRYFLHPVRLTPTFKTS